MYVTLKIAPSASDMDYLRKSIMRSGNMINERNLRIYNLIV